MISGIAQTLEDKAILPWQYDSIIGKPNPSECKAVVRLNLQ
jgi:hypothetical protein